MVPTRSFVIAFADAPKNKSDKPMFGDNLVKKSKTSSSRVSEFGGRVERTIVWADISGREQHNSSLARSSWSLAIHSCYPNDHRMSNDGLTYNVNVYIFFFEIYFIKFRSDSMFKSNGSNSIEIRINSARFDVVKKPINL